jgi:hypothetical protein
MVDRHTIVTGLGALATSVASMAAETLGNRTSAGHGATLVIRKRRAHLWTVRHVSRCRGAPRARPQRTYQGEVADERAPFSVRGG